MSDFVQCPEVFHITPTIKVECWCEDEPEHIRKWGHQGILRLVGDRSAVVHWASLSSTACATE